MPASDDVAVIICALDELEGNEYESEGSNSVGAEKREDPGLGGIGLEGVEEGLGKMYMDWSTEATSSKDRTSLFACSTSLEDDTLGVKGGARRT